MFRFDTRSKKPKLYIELILFLITLAIVVPMMVIDAEKYLLATIIVFAVFFLLTVFIFLDTFRKQVQYNPYSYNTIFYLGLSLFFLSLAIQYIVFSVRGLSAPGSLYVSMVLFTLMNSAENFMLLSAPFILAFSVALFVSNISLIRHERPRIQNLLGMILAFLLVGGEVFLFLFDFYVSGSVEEILLHEVITNAFAGIYLYFECMIIGSIIAGIMAAIYQPDKNADYIIILGCRIKKDGTPYPLLKGRIDKAIEFYREQLEETGKAAVFVPSGGQGSDEVISESLSMKNYLMEQGIPEDRILMEDRSGNTYQNMLFSKQLIEQRNPQAKVLFSTTNYHVFRSGLASRRVKFKTIGIGARTKWYFWPNAAVREFVGLVTGHKIKQTIIFVCIVGCLIALTLLFYRL